MKKVWGVLLVAFLVSHCGGGSSSEKAKSQTSDQAASNSDVEQNNQAIEKLNVVVDCLNGPSNSSSESYGRYLSWVDPDKGVTGKEKVVYGVHKIQDAEKCIEGLEKIKGAAPAMKDLDESAEQYIAHLKALDIVVKQAYDYYYQEDYNDDNFAEGKKLHPDLMKNFQNFLTTSEKFRSYYDAENDKLTLNRIAQMEKEGESFWLHSEKAMFQAKLVVRSGSVIDQFSDLDVPSFTQMVTNYQEAINNLDTYIKSHDAEMQKVSAASGLVRYHKSVLTEAKKMMRRARDNPELTDSEKRTWRTATEWMIDGSPARLIREYNSLVSDVDSINSINAALNKYR